MFENATKKLVVGDRNGKTLFELDDHLPIVNSQNIHYWNAEEKVSQNLRVISSGWNITIENGQLTIVQNVIVDDIH